MTPDDEARMAELVKLIARERDPRRVVMLAKELEQLLASEPEPPEEPQDSQKAGPRNWHWVRGAIKGFLVG